MKKLLWSVSYGWLVLGMFSTAVSAEEHLKNPDFSKGLTDWYLYVHKSMKVKRRVSKGILTVQIAEAGQPQSVQLIQKVTLKEGQRCKLSFDARREGKEVKTQVLCMQQGKPWKSYGLNTSVKLSATWSHHAFTFTVKGLVPKKSPVIRIYLGNQTGTVQFRKFSLVSLKPPGKRSSDHGPVITTILGAGLNNTYFKPSDDTIENVAGEFADAGFTMSWAASPVTWIKHGLLANTAYFSHYRKIAAAMHRHGIGIAFGFHWHNLLPGAAKNYSDIYGEKLDPKTGGFIKKNWNFGSEKALGKFAENAKTLFKKIGPIEMFYADEILLSGAGKKSHLNRPSMYWTSPTYSVEALKSFRQFLAGRKYPGAQQARFPVTTVEVKPGPKANMGLPAVPITAKNSDRLVTDNNWSDSPLWGYWYEWRTGLCSRWLDTITTLAYEANKNNKNWMGCYYEMPVHWMIPELGQNIKQIARLPHIDYIVAGYTTGERYAFAKEIADAAGKKWGLQVEVSRYGKKNGMSVKYIEETFKNAVNDGASLITCYAGMSFRTDLLRDSVPKNYRRSGWYYMPEQAKAWKSCIAWLKQGRGLKKPHFAKSAGN
jgi:hypothetical protein